MINGDDHGTAPLQDSSDGLKTPLLPIISEPQPPAYNGSFLSEFLTMKTFYVVLGPLLSLIVCLCLKLDWSVTSRNMLAVMVWVFEWWLTDAVPMPIASMSPLFLFPLFGICSADKVAAIYMDDVITLVLGSFILALAVEHYNIHRRMALNVSSLLSLSLSQSSSTRIINFLLFISKQILLAIKLKICLFFFFQTVLN